MSLAGANPFDRDAAGEVDCVACGATVDRGDAREYDKHGDRWTREDKEFEYLCKPCHREYSHQPREGLEATLVEAGAGRTDRETFLRRFLELTSDDAEPTRRS